MQNVQHFLWSHRIIICAFAALVAADFLLKRIIDERRRTTLFFALVAAITAAQIINTAHSALFYGIASLVPAFFIWMAYFSWNHNADAQGTQRLQEPDVQNRYGDDAHFTGLPTSKRNLHEPTSHNQLNFLFNKDTAMTMPDERKLTLKIRRSQKAGMLGGKPTFMLDARVELNREDQGLVTKYGLGDLVVYDSKARRARGEQATGHYQDAYVSSYSSVGRMTWQALKAAGASAMAALTLRVTVNSLIKGQHIACKELDELLAAETAMVEACNSLKA